MLTASSGHESVSVILSLSLSLSFPASRRFSLCRRSPLLVFLKLRLPHFSINKPLWLSIIFNIVCNIHDQGCDKIQYLETSERARCLRLIHFIYLYIVHTLALYFVFIL